MIVLTRPICDRCGEGEGRSYRRRRGSTGWMFANKGTPYAVVTRAIFASRRLVSYVLITTRFARRATQHEFVRGDRARAARCARRRPSLGGISPRSRTQLDRDV